MERKRRASGSTNRRGPALDILKRQRELQMAAIGDKRPRPRRRRLTR